MRKGSVRRWVMKPGADPLEVRALLTTLVIIERQMDVAPNAPPEFSPLPDRGDDGDSGPKFDHAGGTPHMPIGGMLWPGIAPRGDATGAFGGPDWLDSPSHPVAPPWFGGSRASLKSFDGGQDPRLVALSSLVMSRQSSQVMAASKLASGNNTASPSHPSTNDPAPLAPKASTQLFSPFAPVPGEPGDEGPRRDFESSGRSGMVPIFFPSITVEPIEPISVSLGGFAPTTGSGGGDASAPFSQLSSYRIGPASNYLLPPPVSAARRTEMTTTPPAPSLKDSDASPVVVRAGSTGQDPAPESVAAPAESDLTPATLPVADVPAPAVTELPEDAGLSLLSGLLATAPFDQFESLTGLNVEETIRDQSVLAVAAVLGGLTAFETGRRIVKRWVNEDEQSLEPADESWIDGELLREWSGRLSPRFS